MIRRTSRRAAAVLIVVPVLLGALTLRAPAQSQILSAKRGFSDVGASYGLLQATGAGWYYTWGPGPANPGNFDAEHYPMIWGGTPSQGTLNNIRNADPEWVLGFNEPERTDQANMSVGAAVSSWNTIVNGLSGSGIKLVSPAVSDTGDGQAWISSFVSQVNSAGLQLDAIAFHWYGASSPSNPAGAANSFLSRVDWYHNLANKPVFITEFAIHDWGGNYSDAEIIEANRQFLDIVVPALESRSYVAGYAFYPWFSDGPLWEGNPRKPTQMAYEYTGVLQGGDFENAAGVNYGEHVAWMAGGELAVNGAAPAQLRYIDALEGSNTLSGNANWSMGGGDYVRIRAGATLRKTGANELSIGGGSVLNSGTLAITGGVVEIDSGSAQNNGQIDIAGGTLRTGITMSGAGNLTVRNGGRWEIYGRGEIGSYPIVQVRAGSALDGSGAASPLAFSSGQALQLAPGSSVLGHVIAAPGSEVAGSGSVSGNLTALGGSLVRVGDNGAGAPSRRLVDDLQSYALGNVRDVASPPWTAHQDTSLVDIESHSGSQVLTYGWASNFRGTSRALESELSLEDGQTATYFFRVNSRTADPDHNVGLGDRATTDGVDFGDYEAQVRLKQGAASGTFDLDARNGGGFSPTLASGLALDAWYNIWLVVDQATDTYDVYLNAGDGDAAASNKLNAAPLAFRNGSGDALNTFLALAGSAPVDNGVRVDDIYRFEGVDLTNPLGGFDPNVTWNPETLLIDGDYSQATGSTLQLNLLDPDAHDVLAVTGQATLAGTLDVSLAVGAAPLQAGDEFDIFDFGSVSGAFETLQLPALAAGLSWDTNNLLTTGALAVVAGLPGDFDDDGDVDGADFLAWQRGDTPGSGSAGELAQWQQNYGTSSAAAAAGAIPEPATAGLFAAAFCLAALQRLTRRRAA